MLHKDDEQNEHWIKTMANTVAIQKLEKAKNGDYIFRESGRFPGYVVATVKEPDGVSNYIYKYDGDSYIRYGEKNGSLLRQNPDNDLHGTLTTHYDHQKQAYQLGLGKEDVAYFHDISEDSARKKMESSPMNSLIIYPRPNMKEEFGVLTKTENGIVQYYAHKYDDNDYFFTTTPGRHEGVKAAKSIKELVREIHKEASQKQKNSPK